MIRINSNGFPVQAGTRALLRSTTIGANHDGVNPRNAALRYMRTFGTDTSFPEGFNSQDARDMPLDEGASIAVVFYGVGSFAAAGLTTESGAVTFPGVGTATFNGELGVNGQVTFEGDGTFTVSGRTAEIGRVTIDAGARPSAFDIAQEVWQGAATGYNAPGTMGEKVNDAGSAGNPWATVLEGGYTAEQLMRLFTAALAGRVSGAAGPNVTFKSIDGTKDRIAAVVDTDGNRLTITLDLT